jgi:hypothetical protein
VGGAPGKPLSPFLVYVCEAVGEATGAPLGASAASAVKHAARRGVDWMIWRVVVAERIPDGLADVRQRWTLPDLLAAHLALDAIEAVEEAARAERERAAKAPRAGRRAGRWRRHR